MFRAAVAAVVHLHRGSMVVAAPACFIVHPSPAAFTESVLAITVFGAGGAGGSMTFNRPYKYKVTHAV